MHLSLIFSSLALVGLIIYGLQLWAVRSALREGRREKESDGSSVFPPISILKPLKGLEDNLFDNLASLCDQDYPEYEMICSLQDLNDPAYRVASKVKEKYPETKIRIMVEKRADGLNPKVNNLMAAYRQARYSYLLISDSNVMVEKDYLKQIVQPMKDGKIGLVNNLIRGVGGKTIGSVFENLHLNSFILGNVCFLNTFLEIPCVIGKSMLMRKEDLEAIGGLRAFKDVLAEDHLIGKKIRERGQKVIVSSYLIDNVNEYWGFRKFLNRHVRWGKMRWKLLGVRYALELITNPVFLACLFLFSNGVTYESFLFVLIVGMLKVFGDSYLGQLIGVRLNPGLYFLSPFKDLLMGLLWFVPFVSDTVTWRGNRYVIGRDTVLSLCPERSYRKRRSALTWRTGMR